MELEHRVGTQITIEGTAHDAAAGAIVLAGDRTPIYIDGLARWDDAAGGQQVTVTGMLRKRGGDPVVNERGEHRHGVPGDWFVLEQASWVVRK